jgi:hypothetical protein
MGRRRLPLSRPVPGRRSRVVGDAAELDLCLRDGTAWRRRNSDLIARIKRSRTLSEIIKKL